MSRPLKLARSGLSEKVYAFRSYRMENDNKAIVATGKREDVTEEFRRVVNGLIQEWVSEGHLQPTETGAAFMNDYFGLNQTESEQ